MRKQILQIIAQACGNSRLAEEPDAELLDSGILDSLALITLLTALEDELGVELQPTQLGREVWRTPGSIALAVLEELAQ